MQERICFINNRKQLIEYFLNSSCSQDNLKIGIEFEKLGVFSHSGKAIPYKGEKGVNTVLSRLSEKYHWKPIKENDGIIALYRKNSQITLEPGGQVELSGRICNNIHEIRAELENHLEEIKNISESLGIKWLGLGVQPVSKLGEIQWVPKSRYKIMAPYMAKHGKLSHFMMKKTASIQVNVDYCGEEDFMEKMRIALMITPIVTAIFANSPVSEGRLNGFLSKRAYIWNYTDPARSGLIGREFYQNPTFSKYVDYALQVPMLFIKRNDRWIKINKKLTFYQYIQKGFKEHRATIDDWELHLSSIFTEIRLRKYIEIRNADSQKKEFALAIPALWKGTLYSKEARQAVLSLIGNLPWNELCLLYSRVPRTGLKTKIGKMKLLSIAKEILKISFSGLVEQKKFNDKKEDESIYLEPIMELVLQDEMCPAEIIIKNWKSKWRGNIQKLIEYTAY